MVYCIFALITIHQFNKLYNKQILRIKTTE